MENLLKQFICIIAIFILFSCNPNPPEQAVHDLLKAMEKQNIETIKTIAPQFLKLKDDEISQLCQQLEMYYQNPQIQITPIDDLFFSVELESPKDQGMILSFTMQKNDEGDYILFEGFSLSRRIDFIPAN